MLGLALGIALSETEKSGYGPCLLGAELGRWIGTHGISVIAPFLYLSLRLVFSVVTVEGLQPGLHGERVSAGREGQVGVVYPRSS